MGPVSARLRIGQPSGFGLGISAGVVLAQICSVRLGKPFTEFTHPLLLGEDLPAHPDVLELDALTRSSQNTLSAPSPQAIRRWSARRASCCLPKCDVSSLIRRSARGITVTVLVVT